MVGFKIYLIIGILAMLINFIGAITCFDIDRMGKINITAFMTLVVVGLIWFIAWPIMIGLNLLIVYYTEKGVDNWLSKWFKDLLKYKK